ncbi:MAG: ABC transporter permease [Myxococcota bacterium]
MTDVGAPDAKPGSALLALLRGEVGLSVRYGRPVWEVMVPRLWATLALMGPALALSFLLALGIGLGSARWARAGFGRGLHAGLLLFSSMPMHWVGLVLVWILVVQTGWMTLGDRDPFADPSPSFAQRALPLVTVVAFYVARWGRHVRSVALERLEASDVRFARSLGCDEKTILLRFVAPGAAVPLVALVAQSFPVLASGLVVVETVFGYPGMGRLIFDSVVLRDAPVAASGFSLYAGLTFAATSLGDEVHRRLDPRVRGRP